MTTSALNGNGGIFESYRGNFQVSMEDSKRTSTCLTWLAGRLLDLLRSILTIRTGFLFTLLTYFATEVHRFDSSSAKSTPDQRTMKLTLPSLLAAVICFATTSVYGALCTPDGLLGVGDSASTYPEDYSFVLYASNSSGYRLGLTYDSSSTSPYIPLTLGTNSGPNVLPQFELKNGSVRTLNRPHKYIATKSSPLLNQAQLYLSDGEGKVTDFVANNASCQGTPSNALRFGTLLGLSTGSGATGNSGFKTGSTVSSPVLQKLLPVSLARAIDFVLVFY